MEEPMDEKLQDRTQPVGGLPGAAQADSQPVTESIVRVVAVPRLCTLEYDKTNCWSVTESGKIAPPICRAAAEAIEEALKDKKLQPGRDRFIVCRCPTRGEVIFGIQT